MSRQGDIRYLGLDVHADTIACAVADSGGEVLDLGIIPNTDNAVARLLKRVGREGEVRACYEAGPTGFALYWQLTRRGVHCDVIAPTLIPKRPGDRIKTDRRDARQLARLYRAGELTAIWIPDEQHEALRDLARGLERRPCRIKPGPGTGSPSSYDLTGYDGPLV